MKNTKEDVDRLKNEFNVCKDVLTALGDPTRQHLISIMLNHECSGHRVLDIARYTNLSRPSVSHHMQILKKAGIVKSRKEGTCIYYYLDPETVQIRHLIEFFSDIQQFMKNVPDRSGEDD